MSLANQDRVALISLPWAPVNSPSLALGQLKAVLLENDIPCQNFYCSNKFYDIIEKVYGRKKDQVIADIVSSTDMLLADWVFGRYAFGVDNEEYGRKHAKNNAVLFQVRNLFEQELESIAQQDWSQFSYVGFTCTFNQIVSSLALARRIKELNPDVTIILGGDRIDEEIGREFVEKISWVDWVVVGEGERTLVEAIRSHQRDGKAPKVSGVVCREEGGETLYKPPMPLSKEEFDNLPVPNFDEFYDENPSNQGVWELSRGCWYGDKNLCSFCGMVPDARYKIRSKPIETLRELKSKYDIEHLEFSDLLVPTNALNTVFAKSGDLGMTFELTTRTDMVRHDEIHQLKTLADGGLKAMYVGIESLHPQCLKMMKKGHLASHCISFMKWAKYYGIRLDWKLLFGIPFEKAEYYFEMLEVLKKIPHLPPPLTQPIMITKRSPYHKELKPLKVPEVYSHIYPDYLDMGKVAHDFEFVNAEFSANKARNFIAIDKMVSYVRYWNNIGSNCSLTIEGNTVVDKRHGKRIVNISSEQLDVLEFCEIPRKSHEVKSSFSEGSIHKMVDEGFLIELDSRMISLIEPVKDPQSAGGAAPQQHHAPSLLGEVLSLRVGEEGVR